MFKKIAIIVLFLGVTAGLGYLLYRFFFGAPAAVTPPASNETQTGGTGLPVAGSGRPTQPGGGAGASGLPSNGGISQALGETPVIATTTLSNGQVQSPVASSQGVSYYNVDDGKFYRLAPDGQTQTLSSQAFPQAKEVIWAPDGSRAAIVFPDDSKVIYDFARQKQTTIPSHWQDLAFNSDGSMIVAKSIALDPANRWLVSASSDGSGTTLLEPLGENGDKVTVSIAPDAGVVAFSATADPVGFDTRDLLVIGQHQENFPALRVEGFGFEPLWSPDGRHLVYSAAGQVSGYEPLLWIADGGSDTIGQGRRSLGIATWADKCAFYGNDTLYCAVPASLPAGAGLERSAIDNVPDRVAKIDLTTGNAVLLGAPDQATSMQSLTVSQDGSKLYYLASDRTLKEMKLR